MLQSIYQRLYKKPAIGGVSGLLSGVFLHIRTLLTDEVTLKAIAGLGIWMATLVSALSAIIYAFKAWDIIKTRVKRWKESRSQKALALVLIASAIVFASCKTRKVDIVQQKSTLQVDSSATHSVKRFDSTNSFNFERFRDSVTEADAYRVDIVPDSGEAISLTGDGSFTGKAKHVTITGKRNVFGIYNREKISDSSVTSALASSDSSNVAVKESQSIKTKHTESAPSKSWVIGVIGLLVIIFIGAYAYLWLKHYKNKI